MRGSPADVLNANGTLPDRICTTSPNRGFAVTVGLKWKGTKMLIDGEKVIDFQFYDEEYEEYSIKSMRIIDFLENYSADTVLTIEEPRWIPVEERLPDLEVVVWVTLALGIRGYNIVSKAQWDGDRWHYPKSHLRVTLKVLAWMTIQIPKPYERSEDERNN